MVYQLLSWNVECHNRDIALATNSLYSKVFESCHRTAFWGTFYHEGYNGWVWFEAIFSEFCLGQTGGVSFILIISLNASVHLCESRLLFNILTGYPKRNCHMSQGTHHNVNKGYIRYNSSSRTSPRASHCKKRMPESGVHVTCFVSTRINKFKR